MKNVFYGVGMGHSVQANNTNDHHVDYASVIMRRIINQFLNVGAKMLVERSPISSQNMSLVDRLLQKECIVFTFDQEVYLSDIKMMNQLIVEDTVRDLLVYSNRLNNDLGKTRVINCFKACFEPYVVERSFSAKLSKKQVLVQMLSAMKDLTSQGRNIPVKTRPTIVNFFAEDSVRDGAYLMRN